MKSYESMIFCEKLSIQFFVAQQIHHESIKSSYVEVRFEIIRNKYINKTNKLPPPPQWYQLLILIEENTVNEWKKKQEKPYLLRRQNGWNPSLLIKINVDQCDYDYNVGN
jgi:hypothetical protein